MKFGTLAMNADVPGEVYLLLRCIMRPPGMQAQALIVNGETKTYIREWMEDALSVDKFITEPEEWL